MIIENPTINIALFKVFFILEIFPISFNIESIQFAAHKVQYKCCLFASSNLLKTKDNKIDKTVTLFFHSNWRHRVIKRLKNSKDKSY